MGFGQAVRSGFTNYFTFKGRASRSEYWYFVLFIFVCALPAALVDRVVIGQPIFQALVTLATFIPNLSALIRRLHDTGRSGWYYFIALIPLVGIIVLIYWLCKVGAAQPNEYGDALTWLAASSSGQAQNVAPAGSRLTATFQGASVEVDSARPLLRVGRGGENDLVVSDRFASGNHARIECRGEQFFLTDQSSNGTYVSIQGMQEMQVVRKEIVLQGSGLIGLGRSPATEPDFCIRFAIQTRR